MVETITGQRLMATAASACSRRRPGRRPSARSPLGDASSASTRPTPDGNVAGLAELLFSRYVFAFEVTSALLITAALGAMVLAHRERLAPSATQADLAAQRMRDYAEHGKHLGPLPAPGVYARHNAVDTPALLPDGTPRSRRSRGCSPPAARSRSARAAPSTVEQHRRATDRRAAAARRLPTDAGRSER